MKVTFIDILDLAIDLSLQYTSSELMDSKLNLLYLRNKLDDSDIVSIYDVNPNNLVYPTTPETHLLLSEEDCLN